MNLSSVIEHATTTECNAGGKKLRVNLRLSHSGEPGMPHIKLLERYTIEGISNGSNSLLQGSFRPCKLWVDTESRTSGYLPVVKLRREPPWEACEACSWEPG